MPSIIEMQLILLYFSRGTRRTNKAFEVDSKYKDERRTNEYSI